MIRKIPYYFTPCVLAVIFLVVVIIKGLTDENLSEGWGMFIVEVALPYSGVVIIADIIARIFLKKDIITLWLVEILFLVLSLYIPKL